MFCLAFVVGALADAFDKRKMLRLTEIAQTFVTAILLFNSLLPKPLRGRLASIEMINYLTGPMLGSAKMGIVAERFSTKIAIVSGGILCVVFVGGLAFVLPKFTAYDGREGVKQKEREEAERAELGRISQGEF